MTIEIHELIIEARVADAAREHAGEGAAKQRDEHDRQDRQDKLVDLIVRRVLEQLRQRGAP